MAWKVDERILEDIFIKLMIEKANVIKDHLKKSMHPLIIVANIGPTLEMCLNFMTLMKKTLSSCA